MKVDFTGRQTEVSAELRRLAERKLAKLGRLLPSVTRAHVILTRDKHRLLAEVSVHSRQLDLAALESSSRAPQSLVRAIDKLLRQAQKQRARRRPRKGAASPRLQPAARRPQPRPAGPGAGSEARVVRSRRALLKPMTVEEAALELDEREDGVLVFRDATSERMKVLFRRKDGQLGLIEPEA